MIRACAAGLVLAFLAGPGMAACRLALALGLDVSGSVDSGEYRLQLDGLAGALEHPEVVAAIFAVPAAPVRIAVYEWSGPAHQELLVGWTVLTERSVLAAVADRLRAVQRQPAEPSTALGTAMLTGAALLAGQTECWRRTLDLSGDGKRNTGPRPRDVQAQLRGAGLTINALAVGADDPQTGDIRQAEIGELVSYFRARVLMGPDAFVETALGFRDFEAAMVRKLRRELESPVLSRAGTAGPADQ